MIPVTRPYFPDIRKVEAYLEGIYSRQRLTNGGPLVEELATRLEAYLGVRNLVLVANGTLALQIAYRVLGISGRLEGQADAVTTPFSFIATASSLKWEGVQPRFADIQRGGWCLDPAAIDIRDAQLGPDPCLVDTLTLAQNGPENARNSHAEEHLHR